MGAATFSISFVIREEEIEVAHGPVRGAGSCARAEVPPPGSRTAWSWLGKGASRKQSTKRSRSSMVGVLRCAWLSFPALAAATGSSPHCAHGALES